MKTKKDSPNVFNRIKPPYIAKMSEVIITKTETSAHIEYKEKNVGGVIITFGPDVAKMTNQEILEKHNELLLTQMEMKREYEHVAVEIPRGKPQMEFSEQAQQWVPRGDVLRCIIHYHESGIGIEIDDRLLSLEDFGRMLRVHEGWGMRIAFVPEEDIFFDPKTKLEDPDEKKEKQEKQNRENKGNH